jgi:hypothetical protein
MISIKAAKRALSAQRRRATAAFHLSGIVGIAVFGCNPRIRESLLWISALKAPSLIERFERFALFEDFGRGSIEEFNSNHGPIFCSQPRDRARIPGVRRH